MLMTPARNDYHIFVQIPSYRDDELIPTLLDLIRHCRKPDSLRIAVCWQHGEESSLDQFLAEGFLLKNSTHSSEWQIHTLVFEGVLVRLQDYSYLDSLGCGWARSRIQKLYNGEKYSLQLDSHHRFIEDWDTCLVDMFESLKSASPKPILVGYPPPYDPVDHTVKKFDEVPCMHFAKFGGKGIIIYRRSPLNELPIDGSPERPIRARFFSGGFAFSEGHFIREVPYDEGHFFAGEEISMAVRAFTNGYDLFYPHKPILWHYYGRSGKLKIWSDHSSEAVRNGLVKKSAEDRADEAQIYVERLFGIRNDLPLDNILKQFGGERTLEDYERYAGLSFKHKAVTLETLQGREPQTISTEVSKNAWESTLLCETDVNIKVDSLDNFFDVSEVESVEIRIVDNCGDAKAVHLLEGSEVENLKITGGFFATIIVKTGVEDKPRLCLVTVKSKYGEPLMRLSMKVKA